MPHGADVSPIREFIRRIEIMVRSDVADAHGVDYRVCGAVVRSTIRYIVIEIIAEGLWLYV